MVGTCNPNSKKNNKMANLAKKIEVEKSMKSKNSTDYSDKQKNNKKQYNQDNTKSDKYTITKEDANAQDGNAAMHASDAQYTGNTKNNETHRYILLGESDIDLVIGILETDIDDLMIAIDQIELDVESDETREEKASAEKQLETLSALRDHLISKPRIIIVPETLCQLP